jgi:hypothetical protein
LHGAQTQPDVLGNGRDGPALVVQGPDLRMQRLPAGLALLRALLGGGGRLDGGWHGHRDRPLGQQDRLLAHQGIDGLEGLFMGQKHLVERFPEILQQVETVCDLRGSRSPLACALGIGL